MPRPRRAGRVAGGNAAQCDAGELPLLPGDGGPVDEPDQVGEVVVAVVVEEELLKYVDRTWEAACLGAGRVLLEVR